MVSVGPRTARMKAAPIDSRINSRSRVYKVTIRTARARTAKTLSKTSSKFPGGMSRRAATR